MWICFSNRFCLSTLLLILDSMQVSILSLFFSIINSDFSSMQLLLLMLLIICFVFRYFSWWHLQICFNCSSNLVLSRSSSSTQFVEFNGIVRQCGGVTIAKSMFLLDSSVGFRGNACPCMKHVEFLIRKFESNYSYSQVLFSSSLFLFLYPLLILHDDYRTWTWFRILFRYIVVLREPWVRAVGFSRFNRSSDFVLFHIESLSVTLKRHCYQEARHFLQQRWI